MASQKRSSSALVSLSVGSIIKVPAAGQRQVSGSRTGAAMAGAVGQGQAGGRQAGLDLGRCRRRQVLRAAPPHQTRATTWWARGSRSQ